MASFTATSISIISLAKSSLVPSARISSPNSVSLSIKGRRFPSITLQPTGRRFQVTCATKQETVQKVCDIVKKQLALPEGSSVTGESKFATLGADSLYTVNSVGAKVLEFIADFGKPTAPLPAAIVACVPTKVHIEGAGKTEFKISPTEITDAMKAGLDQPIMPEPEDEEHENKGKDESCEAAESGAF